MSEITITSKYNIKSVKASIKEIFEYKDFLYILIWIDLKIRYKQTVLGIAWVVFQPLISTIIFTVFFGNLAKIPSGKLPYSLFVLCGLVFWQFFSSSLVGASDSMIANESIIQKVYFPKVILPIVSIMTSSVDFIFNVILLLVYAGIIGYFPNWSFFIVFPLATITTVVTALGCGLFISALNVRYRDVRYVLPFCIQILLFLTPIIYPMSIVNERNKLIMAINPISTVIESVRLTFSGNGTLSPQFIIISIISMICILIIGFIYFNKTQKFFADII